MHEIALVMVDFFLLATLVIAVFDCIVLEHVTEC